MKFIPFTKRYTPPIRAVIDAAAEEHDTTPLLFLASQKHPIARARFIAMHLARKRTGASYPTLAKAFSKGCHTTALNACRRAEEMLVSDPWAQDYAKRIARRADRILLEQVSVRR